MALFTDGPISTIDDLREHDSQLADVASTEGIDVTRKLALAQDELQIELENLLNRVPNIGGRRPVSIVVATPALKLWHKYRSLTLVYTDAYYSHLNDRYKKKLELFQSLAGWAEDRLRDGGVGIVDVPIARAATPVLISVPGTVPTGAYFATVAWLNSAGEEGAPAVPGMFQVEIPVEESGNQSFAVMAQNAPAVATGWNIYVGTDPERLVLQNPEPLAPGEMWLATNPLETAGRGPESGQLPNFYEPAPRFIQRG